MSRTSGKLSTTTTAAHTETSRPVLDSATPRPVLICWSTAVGSISAVTMNSVPAPSTSREGHGKVPGSGPAGMAGTVSMLVGAVGAGPVMSMSTTLKFDTGVNVKALPGGTS